MLEKVEPQRVRDDLILILKEKSPLKQIMRIQKLAGFHFISPYLTATQSAFRFLSSLEKELNWFKNIYYHRRQLDAWLIYLIGLIESLEVSDIKSICRRFAFRRGEEKRILAYKGISRKFILQLSQKGIKPSKIFILLEPLSYEVILLLKAKYKNRIFQKHIEDFFDIYNGMRICICGEDLHRLGIAPGPKYQKIFAKVLTAKLNGLVKTKEEEIILIKKLMKIK